MKYNLTIKELYEELDKLIQKYDNISFNAPSYEIFKLERGFRRNQKTNITLQIEKAQPHLSIYNYRRGDGFAYN